MPLSLAPPPTAAPPTAGRRRRLNGGHGIRGAAGGSTPVAPATRPGRIRGAAPRGRAVRLDGRASAAQAVRLNRHDSPSLLGLGHRRGTGLPAAALLETRSAGGAGVEAAVPEVAREGTPEVAAGRTGGRRSAADPAARRLCLWCAAVRAVPHDESHRSCARKRWGGCAAIAASVLPPVRHAPSRTCRSSATARHAACALSASSRSGRRIARYFTKFSVTRSVVSP